MTRHSSEEIPRRGVKPGGRTRAIIAVAALVAQVAIVSLASPRRPAPVEGLPSTDSAAPSPAGAVPAAPPLPETAASSIQSIKPTWGATARAAGISGTLSIEPNPLVVCEKTGLGQAVISWSATGTTFTEVRIGSPDGALLTTDGTNGSMKTGPWIGKNTTLWLQDATNGIPRTADHTLARLAIDSTVIGPCD